MVTLYFYGSQFQLPSQHHFPLQLFQILPISSSPQIQHLESFFEQFNLFYVTEEMKGNLLKSPLNMLKNTSISFFFSIFQGVVFFSCSNQVLLPLCSLHVFFTLFCDFNHKFASFLCCILLFVYLACYCTFIILSNNMIIANN